MVATLTARSLAVIAEDAHDYAELGAVLNGFSLTESGSLSTAIEKTGQAVDATYLSTTNLVSGLSFAIRCALSIRLTDSVHFVPAYSLGG